MKIENTDNNPANDEAGPQLTAGGVSRRELLGSTVAGILGVGSVASGIAASPGVLGASNSGPSTFTHTAVRDGNWSDTGTWERGRVPNDGARVFVESGVTVTVAQAVSTRLKIVEVAGTLRHAPDRESKLRAETIKTRPGSTYEIGTSSTPIQPTVTATVEFIDEGPIDESVWPERKNKGLMAMGAVEIVGAQKTPWAALAEHAWAGDSSIELQSNPDNWSEGDRIVLPGMEAYSSQDLDNEDEECIVADVAGTTVSFETPLEYDHLPPKSDLGSYALNLTRNVVMASENTAEHRRAHVMIMSTESEVRWIRFDELGRTNKDQYLTNPVRNEDELPGGLDPNPAARYPLHWHRTGIDASDPHVVEGAVVDGSPGWGIVNHHAYVDVTDSITYRVRGAGFVAEGGNERGSFKRNFALRSEGSGEKIDSRAAGENGHAGDPPIDDFGHAGHGFWLQSPLVETVNNVAAGHRHYAYAIWTRPLLEHEMAECSEVTDSRVTYCPNLPMEYVDDDRQGPLLEAIEAGRFSNNDDLMRRTGKIPSTFRLLERFEGNEAFGSAGGLDFSRNHFKWKHERFSDFSVIDDFTVYNIGPHIHENGEVRGVVKRGVKKGGNQGIKFRYCSNVTVRNSRLISRDGSGTAIAPHDYLWTSVVEDSTIEGWHLGIGTGEHRLTWIRNNEFYNEVDVDWVIGNAGPAVLEDNVLDTFRYAFSLRDVKAGELFGTRPSVGASLDGRTAFFDEQRPGYVPISSKDELASATTHGSGYGHMAEVLENTDDAEDCIGKTNRELLEKYDVATMGALLPDEAVDESFVSGGKLAPADPGNAPETVWLDPTTGSVGDGFDIVTDPDAAGNQCLRVNETGTATPPRTAANVTSMPFECAAGTYTIFGRIRPDAWNGDSVFFKVDDGDWLEAEKLKSPIGFEWHDASPNNQEAYKVDLQAGEHTIHIGCGNDGVKIDNLCLRSDASVVGAYGGAPNSGTGNSAPIAADDSATVERGGQVSIDVVSNDSDEDGSLDPSSTAVSTPPAHGSVITHSDGTLDYQHDGSDSGSDSFTYTVTDGEGATSTEGTVSISVQSSNSDPTVTDDSATVEQGETVAIDVLSNDADPEGSLDSTSVSVVSAPNYGTASVNTDGSIEYSHGGGTETSDRFDYTVADKEGAQSDVATVTVSIESNGQPSVTDDSASIESGKSTTIDVLANDSISEGTLDPASVSVEGSPSYGSVSVGSDGSVEYVHDGSQTSNDSFTYTVASHEGVSSNPATVSVAVGSTNEPPTGSNDTASVENGDTVTIDVLSNDTAPEGSLDSSSLEIESDPSSGTLTRYSDGRIEYDHDGSETSEDSFTYTVADEEGRRTEQVLVSISIDSVERAKQSPYTDHDIARIQAEDFDSGGEGVAYHDTSSGNKAGAYRETDVDIQQTKDTNDEYHLAWVRDGEWWEYTVDVPTDGEYTLQAHVGGKESGELVVIVEDSPVATLDVPETGEWQEWVTVDGGTVDLSAGTVTIRLEANGDQFNINWFGFEQSGTNPPRPDGQSPYTDHDLSRIQGEDFDIGGEGVAYHDTNAGNKALAYRDTDVDIQPSIHEGYSYHIAWVREGEWWEYTIDVPADGEYALTAAVAGKNATSLDVSVDGSSVTSFDIPNTGDWQNWVEVQGGSVRLSSGTHTVRLTANGGEFNLNWFGLE